MSLLKNTPPRKLWRAAIAIVCVSLAYAANPCALKAAEDPLAPLLRQLDVLLDNSSIYVEARQSRIALLENMRNEKDIAPEQRWQINMSLYDEYLAFNFDKATECLYDNLDIARRMNRRDRLDRTNIMLAMLYTNAGMYLEASVILAEEIDPANLDPESVQSYRLAQQVLAWELAHYSKQEQVVGQSWRQYEYYSQLLFEEPDDSYEWLTSRGIWLMNQHRFDEAERIFTDLLDAGRSTSRLYAMAAYRLGEICDQTGRHDEMLVWYARSAMADIQSATKDNASLCSLANHLFGRHDIARAFRYIRVSMDDALFYNAKLRPWQVAALMPHIEAAAQEAEQARARQLRNFTVTVSVLVFFLLVACAYLWRSWRQTRRTQRIMSERNRQIDAYNRKLSELNKAISEANAVKEEYIGLFLSICSDYIDRLIEYRRHVKRRLSAGKGAELLKETDSATMIEEETKRFYEIFDSAFLKLYPTFVEDFNSLLVDEEHIELHKGDLLNTELRIFALIRLGITDSSKIASLLRYSVNTIYNYRAKVKNKSKYQRDDFEESVRQIGSFKVS